MDRYRRFWIGTALMALMAASLTAQGVAKAAAQPGDVVSSFYRWYIQALTAPNGDPIKKGRPMLQKYVAPGLLADIDRRLKNREMDEDYFLQAQDYLSDWKNNIAVSKLAITGTTATAVLTLSAKGEAPYRLKITLMNTAGTWKISKVQRP